MCILKNESEDEEENENETFLLIAANLSGISNYIWIRFKVFPVLNLILLLFRGTDDKASF